MSYHDYKLSQGILARDPSINSLIMAAMMKADEKNLALLREAWPEVWTELLLRYNAPGGLIDGETLPTDEFGK